MVKRRDAGAAIIIGGILAAGAGVAAHAISSSKKPSLKLSVSNTMPEQGELVEFFAELRNTPQEDTVAFFVNDVEVGRSQTEALNTKLELQAQSIGAKTVVARALTLGLTSNTVTVTVIQPSGDGDVTKAGVIVEAPKITIIGSNGVLNRNGDARPFEERNGDQRPEYPGKIDFATATIIQASGRAKVSKGVPAPDLTVEIRATPGLQVVASKTFLSSPVGVDQTVSGSFDVSALRDASGKILSSTSLSFVTRAIAVNVAGEASGESPPTSILLQSPNVDEPFISLDLTSLTVSVSVGVLSGQPQESNVITLRLINVDTGEVVFTATRQGIPKGVEVTETWSNPTFGINVIAEAVLSNAVGPDSVKRSSIPVALGVAPQIQVAPPGVAGF